MTNTATQIHAVTDPSDFVPEDDIPGILQGLQYKLDQVTIEQGTVGYSINALLVTVNHLRNPQENSGPGHCVRFKANVARPPQIMAYMRALLEFTKV